MDAKLLKVILDDETLTDEQIAVLLVKAQKQAANQHFWADDDIPTEAELERFYNRYEFEIYDLAKAINSDDARGGLVSHTELGVTRNWGQTGKKDIELALAKIPPKTYVGLLRREAMPKLRLKDLRLNQVPFYYQTYDGTVDEVDEDGNLTGESIPKYSNPVRVLARVSPNSGNAEDSPFGKDIVYDKTISTVQKLPIDEYSKLFIDVVPILNEDGSTDTEPDYICVCPKHDLQQNLWAIRKIKGNIHAGQNNDQSL